MAARVTWLLWRRQRFLPLPKFGRLRIRKLERRRVHLVRCRFVQSSILLAEMDRQGVDALVGHDRKLKVKRRTLERCIEHDQDFLSKTEAHRRRGSPRPEWKHPRRAASQNGDATLGGEHRIRKGYVRVP